MEKWIIFFALSFIVFSCNKLIKDNQEDMWGEEINDKEEFYSVLNDFLESSMVKTSENSVLIQFYLDEKNDSVLKISDSPVIDCKNYVGSSTFNNRIVLVFCKKQLESRLIDFIDFKATDKTYCLEKIDSSGLYIMDTMLFLLKEGKFIQN